MLLTIPFLFFLCRSRLGCNLNGFFKVRSISFLLFLSGNTTDCSLPFFLYRSRLEHHLDGFFKVRGVFFFIFSFSFIWVCYCLFPFFFFFQGVALNVVLVFFL